ncbi:DNA polymerase [Mycolicibacterium porcinum]|uniref:DNA-directed DNA polymerase n=1 Tax=Mycolicibacterium porcinum TaxID=39693 RepID=A0ABV3VJR8_9MYCO
MIPTTLPDLSLGTQQTYDVALDARVYQGDATDPVIDALDSSPTDVSVDVETMGKEVDDRYLVKVVSCAWSTAEGAVVVTLNPSRDPRDAERLTRILNAARVIVGHNTLFDIPIMVVNGWCSLEHTAKVVDTLVLYRMLDTHAAGTRTLENVVTRYLTPAHAAPVHEAQPKSLAAALGSKPANRFAVQDIGSTSYLDGNRADALATLRVYPRVYRDAAETTSRGYVTLGITDRFTDPYAVIGEVCLVHTVALRATCVGVRADTDYDGRYVARTQGESDAAKAVLDSYGIEPTKSDTLLNVLHRDGVKTDTWERTATGKVKTSKDVLKKRLYAHPAIEAWITYRGIAKARKDYVQKIGDSVHVDGKVRSSAQVLGATRTGRMSYANPPLQQFPAAARPVILGPDDGDELWSVDWTSIEPVLLAYLSGDTAFIDAYEAGVGVYEQVMEITGTERKVAKVITLAFNYGQGAAGLAESLGVPVHVARGYQSAIAERWSAITRYTDGLKSLARRTGLMYTIGGRVVTCSSDHVAVNYHVQGSAADLMHRAVATLALKGVPEAVVLMVHDEIVTTAPFAEVVGEVMRTPPDFLVRAAGRVPVLRAEPELLGSHWDKH